MRPRAPGLVHALRRRGEPSRLTRIGAVLLLALFVALGCRTETDAAKGTTPPKGAVAKAPAPTAPSTSTGGGTAAPSPSPAYTWTMTPDTLDVLRDTAVALSVSGPGLPTPGTAAKAPTSSCSWDFGDGDTGAGCQIRHVFRGGLADAWVTLVLRDPKGAELSRERRKLALERLRVVPVAPVPVSEYAKIPAKSTAEDAKRIVFVGPLHGAERQTAAIEAMRGDLAPDLVIATGGFASAFSEEGFASWMQTFLTPLTAASIPLVVLPGAEDISSALGRKVFESTMGQILFKPVLDYQDDSGYPYRFSFLFGRNYVIVVDSSGGDLSDQQFRWLKAELAQGAAYPRVLVVSHLPPAPLTAKDTGHIKRAYKVTELLNRYRNSVLFCGHDPVFYDARYASARVVSVGGGTEDCPPLTGEQVCQGTTLCVVDTEGKQAPRIRAVMGPGYERILPSSLLPATVDRYEAVSK